MPRHRKRRRAIALAPLARVGVPAGRDYVAGVFQDADGVESVRVYGLSRR